ncbi:jg23130 [Pararge aegeria aegeria]|uniref:Jg23130 protein n=1 Tax=Pararge aegeria aegeria TaxID=348720 RepID=A0A8S4SHR1_9NEOP|nr:jg23130 [Pararge aegeria aegeria]
MPELIEQMYCSQQIVIPPKFPYILKRYCKAAIKTQPYDLLRWSFEYFSALSQNRMPPVKLRLEYPIYSTEGGLTRGCLKVLANQLAGMPDLPLPVVRKAWRGFCLDPNELKRIFCLCEVYMREETVPFLRFIAVAGGLLTKTLTHTMILLCETLTKEPDGGSAAIPITDFLTMYEYLARVDASKDIKYFNGFREGETPVQESIPEEEEVQQEVECEEEKLSDDYWQDTRHLQKLTLTGDYVSHAPRLSEKLNLPVIGKLERSPSVERATRIERESYLRERKGRAVPSEEVEQKLRELSSARVGSQEVTPGGMVAGRQMSTTSGEFIVANIEKEVMDHVNEQIAVLPDPDLKKKKAKPEEVEMIKDLLEKFLDDNMDVIAPELEEVEEEEQAIPDVTIVYAVPGIGPPVDKELIRDFEEYALEVSKVQADVLMPRNIRHFLCPPLEM